MKDRKEALEGRVALITGSSRGIGKAIALSLAREGADIIVCGSRAENVAATEKNIKQYGVKTYAGVFDVRDAKQISHFFSGVVRKIGRLDILINNVGGVREHAKFEELTDEQWLDSYQLNFMSMVRFTRAALPLLRASKYPRIINISSVPGRQPGFFNPHYGAAKAAVNFLNKYLATALAPEQILVNAILPANVAGDLWEAQIRDRSARDKISVAEARKILEKDARAKIPLGRLAEPEDVAGVVAFLASDKSSFITGTCISVDGGVVKAIF